MTESSDLSLPDVLEIENDASVLDFVCPDSGVPMWSQIRVQFIRMLLADRLYRQPLTGKSSTATAVGQAISTMRRSIVHNIGMCIGNRARADICIAAEGVADQLIDGHWFNRLSGHFVQMFPERTLTLHSHFEWRWPFPRHGERVIMHAPQQARSTIVGLLRVRDSHREAAKKLVGLVSERAQRLLGWSPGPVRESILVEYLARKAAAMANLFDGYTTTLTLIRPKLLMVISGCYGPAAPLLAAAHAAGISTAEYQHGAVSAGHDAYNFAPAILEDERYKLMLPQRFLSYGNWWDNQINVPLQKTPLGNPHRDARIAATGSRVASREDLLILSDGIDFESYLNLARAIAPVAHRIGLRVVIRPHPLERTRVRELHGTGIEGIHIDDHVDIYSSFVTAHAVVSELSTGVFEAVGLADKVFLWETEKSRFGFPSHPFETFSSASTLMELLQRSSSGQLNESLIESIWAPDWQSRYTHFVNTVNANSGVLA